MRRLLLLLVVLLPGCDDPPPVGLQTPRGARAEAPPAAPPDPALARERARLAELAAEVQRLEREARQTDRLPSQFAAWRALAERATGTEYVAYAQERLARMDAAAAASLAAVQATAAGRAEVGRWDSGLARLADWRFRHAGTPTCARLAAFEQRYRARYAAWSRARLRRQLVFDRDPPVAIGPIRVAAATGTRQAGPALLLVQRRQSRLTLTFELEAPIPPVVYLRVRHESLRTYALHDAPITLTLNGKLIIHDWSPAPYHSGPHQISRWTIGGHLRPGANTLVWTLGRASTAYRLFWVEVSDQPGD